MKVVHLILAHAFPNQLVRLVEKLTHPDAVIYIHVDLKSNLKDFQILNTYSNVHFIKKRVKVHWAGYSVVQATINSFQEIMDDGIEFDYLNLLSGQDYPTKKIKNLHEFLANNPGKAFMGYYDIATVWKYKRQRENCSLLEVGTGFHPELTGRENIFLNGQILGMKKIEIQLAFDEIVDFSGVEKFIDTPVKRYSSGMYVRLAFAVAAHMDPEILIVDEVLSVGDADFQKNV